MIELAEFESLIREIECGISKSFMENITGGIRISLEVAYTPVTIDYDDYIIAKYFDTRQGGYIEVFYGSVKKLFNAEMDMVDLKRKLCKSIYHEIRHCIEKKTGIILPYQRDKQYLTNYLENV